MKSTFILGLVLFCVTIVNHVDAQHNYILKSAKASVQGTSSLHDWESEITDVKCTGHFQATGGELTAIKSAEIRIRVESIKSTKGKMMDKKTYDAFKSDKNPFIIYTLTSTKIKAAGLHTAEVEATGNLSMAGFTKSTTVTAKGKVHSNGDIQLSVTEKIKMGEFKMKPPTAMMGTIVVGDEVTIIFDLILTPSDEQAKKF